MAKVSYAEEETIYLGVLHLCSQPNKCFMQNVLLTGATGNIGSEVVAALQDGARDVNIIAAVRNVEKSKNSFTPSENLSFRTFDFDKPEGFARAFEGIDILFLLRPPHISDVEKYFVPLLKQAHQQGVDKVVFLSVQGAEKSGVIPHNKIEKAIKAEGMRYIFVRPGYFMQNLTTTLLPEIQNERSITLPAGKGVFNWIDTKNIGEASAVLIEKFEDYQNDAYEITGSENKNFEEVTALINSECGTNIKYKSTNPISFFFKKRKSGMPSGFAIVMTMLHFLPRLQSAPHISDDYTRLAGRKPTLLREFINREKNRFLPS